MKIALLFPGTAIDGFALNGVRSKTGWIHHGLCYISAALKQEGHEVVLIDLRMLSGWEDLPDIVRRIMPDVVGITMMSVDYDAAVRSAEIIKSVSGSIKVVVGGVHPTLAEHELTGNPNIDLVFKGEAEVTLPKILNDIVAGRLAAKVITGEPPDLNKIPFADRALFDILEAPIVPFMKMPLITAIPGRGCAYNCSFCQPAERVIFGHKVRRMYVERFIEELELARGLIGLNSLMIHDDFLLEDLKWVERFLKLYRDRKFRRSFTCQSRADTIVKNPGLFRDMRRHGLDMVMIGFESGSQRVLNFLRKGTTVEQNYEAARICKKLGIRVWANYMMGIPTETKEEVLETVKMIKWMKPYIASPTFYTPAPGSDLYEFCMKNDLSLVKEHKDYKRSPESPKLKGIDYEFLNKALAETVKISYPLRMKRKIDKLRLGHFNKDLIKNYTPAGCS